MMSYSDTGNEHINQITICNSDQCPSDRVLHTTQLPGDNCNYQPCARLLAERVQMLNKEMQPVCCPVINTFVVLLGLFKQWPGPDWKLSLILVDVCVFMPSITVI